jgi:hypothetical protein|tara:strand:- start:1179 stop:1382 length:204 start_codon:yes stop_codon:yes gene_type:complete
MTKDIEELYTIKEIYPIFKAKSERSFKRTIDSLSSKHPKEQCFNRYFGSKQIFTANDIERIKILCLK